MIVFGQTCAAIAGTAGKLEKIAILAAYLRELQDLDLAPATRYFTGNPFPQAQARSLTLGGRSIVNAAAQTWRIDDGALSAAYRVTGDLGAALGPFVQRSHDLGLFRETLTPASLYVLFVEIADAAGKNAQKRRRILCERILSACTEPLEATYVIKIMAGELRIGLREGLVVDAIAEAFSRESRVVRRAASVAGDLGAIALAAKHDTLEHVTIGYHAPIAFMLASPIAYGSDYKELARSVWLVDDKYDGIRAQAHVTPERVSLFSRTLNDVAGSFPEVVEALRAVPGSFALDGELVAVRDGHVLPFRFLQARLQRKVVEANLLQQVPVRYFAFDALARDEEFLLHVPLAERRAQLAELLASAGTVVLPALQPAPWTTLEADASPEVLHERFNDSRTRGNEGLVLKHTNSPYTPGRRGRSWLKLKRELATLDCIVVAVERGHGKRINMLSDYTFAVRDSETLAVLGKAYSGLTDLEISEMTAWFEAHRLPPQEARAAYESLELKRREMLVEPTVVVEIAFDIIARSDLHASGYALRFPRIVRLRRDKPPEEADTVARVAEIYAEMLAREGIETES